MNYKRKYRKNISLILVFLMMLTLISPISAQPKPSDIAGHWAEETISHMASEGIIGGYSDGTFKPDNNITRGEFAALVVRAFDLQAEEGKIFSDTASHWARDIIAIANYHGIVSGYNEKLFGPDDFITREQMAAIMVNTTKVSEASNNREFVDSHQISQWARDAVNKSVTAELIGGYSDNTFRPKNNATRAEAVVVLSRSLGLLYETRENVFSEAGTYGNRNRVTEVDGDIFIDASGVTLQNYTIKGDLTVTEGVGDGEVNLNNVDVTGIIYVNGGGVNSIYINGGSHKELIVNNTPTKVVRVVVSNISRINLEISDEAEDQEVVLVGKFGNVLVKGNNNTIITSGETTIQEVKITQESSNATLQINKDTVVERLILDATTTVNNEKDTIRDISGQRVNFSNISNSLQRTSSGGGGSGGRSGSRGNIAPQTYQLEIISENGTVTGEGTYQAGTEVMLMASVSEGYEFEYWKLNDEIISYESTFNFTMPSENTVITAHFTPIYQLDTVAVNGIATGGGSYKAGTKVTLAATPNTGYEFEYWKLNDEIISYESTFKFTMIPEDTVIEAHFTSIYQLDVIASNNGTAKGGGTYKEGVGANITATPKTGYEFAYWVVDGEAISTEAEFEYTIPSSDTEIRAYFVKENHLPVRTAEELDNIRNNLSAKYYQIADIDLQGLDWVPIGRAYKLMADQVNLDLAFRGTYNGNNYSIKNLKIVGDDITPLLEASIRSGDTDKDLDDLEENGIFLSGLFETAAWCEIKNINIINADVEGYLATSIVALLLEGTLENISVTGTINGVMGAGGIAGQTMHSDLNNLRFNGHVKSDVSWGESIDWYSGYGGIVSVADDTLITSAHVQGKIEGKNNTGGIIGTSYDSTIKNSKNYAEVNGGTRTGGLVGRLDDGQIINSYAVGNVTGDDRVGGLVGYLRGNILDSHAKGNVQGVNDIGGLVGSNNSGLITTSFAEGNVYGNIDVGGLVGYNNREIDNSYATGTVSGVRDVGGLVGSMSNSATIRNSSAKNPSLIRLEFEETFFGRVVGRNIGGTLENNYANINMLSPFEGAFSTTGDDTVNGQSKDFENEYKLEFFISGGTGDIIVSSLGKIILSGSKLHGELPIEMNVTPSKNYQIKHWEINGVTTTNNNQTTLIMNITEDTVIEVVLEEEALPKHLLIFEVDTNKASLEAFVEGINIQSYDNLTEGTEVTFQVTPNLDYKVVEWRINGVLMGHSGDEFTLIITSVTEVEILLEKVVQLRTVNFSVQSESSGTITAQIEGTTINSGDSVPDMTIVNFNVNPNANYIVKDWFVNGESFENPSNTFTLPVDENVNVVAIIEKEPYLGYAETSIETSDRFWGSYSAGNLMADAVRDATGADIALFPGGTMTMHRSIAPGGFYSEDLMQLYSTFISSNRVVVGELKGQDIEELLIERSGRFSNVDVQVSGIEYDIKITVTNQVYGVDVRTPGGSNIVSDQYYTVAFNSHNFQFYNLDNKIQNKWTTTETELEILIDYVTRLYTIPASLEATRIRLIYDN